MRAPDARGILTGAQLAAGMTDAQFADQLSALVGLPTRMPIRPTQVRTWSAGQAAIPTSVFAAAVAIWPGSGPCWLPAEQGAEPADLDRALAEFGAESAADCADSADWSADLGAESADRRVVVTRVPLSELGRWGW